MTQIKNLFESSFVFFPTFLYERDAMEEETREMENETLIQIIKEDFLPAIPLYYEICKIKEKANLWDESYGIQMKINYTDSFHEEDLKQYFSFKYCFGITKIELVDDSILRITTKENEIYNCKNDNWISSIDIPIDYIVTLAIEFD